MLILSVEANGEKISHQNLATKHVSMCRLINASYIYIYIYPTPPLGQDMTQGQF